jgi:hypothetical protein
MLLEYEMSAHLAKKGFRLKYLLWHQHGEVQHERCIEQFVLLPARSGMPANLFIVMVLLNFYLYVLIHYYFTTSFDIFYSCFCLLGTLATRHRQEAFLEALSDEGQQQMAGAWPTWLEVGAAQQEALEELEVGATQQEAPEDTEVEEEADDQPQVTYKLVKF